MSHICSKIESIDNLWLEPLPSKVTTVTKITKVDNIIVALGANGKIYTNGVVSHVAYTAGHEGKLGAVLDGCIKLKVLSANAVRQHKEEAAKRQAKRDHKWNVERFTEAAKALGIALSEEQAKLVGEGI
jgi:exosome complex RNA-binding protein Rrp4